MEALGGGQGGGRSTSVTVAQHCSSISALRALERLSLIGLRVHAGLLHPELLSLDRVSLNCTDTPRCTVHRTELLRRTEHQRSMQMT